MKILVTGGNGYIGSHTMVDLIENGMEVVCVDNLSRSNRSTLDAVEKLTSTKIPFYEVDLCDLDASKAIFEHEKDIDGIIHFAAYKSVGESVEKPLMYYRNNINSLLNVIELAENNGVQNLIYSSSCSVYGNANELPVTEDTPLEEPASPYANTKKIGEDIVRDATLADSLKAISLRYFNPVGAHSSALIGEEPIDKPNNLVPVITQTAIGQIDKMHVWGTDYDTRDGSCIRDYIHVSDIAHAHTLAVKHLLANDTSSSYDVYNLGTGNGVTVLEALDAFEKVSGQKVNYEKGPRREGDVVAVYADNTKAKENLQWETQYGIEEMMKSAWDWQQNLAKKYAK